MIQNKRISLIVPCKNEERIIGAFIKRVPKYIDEIIVVDNNSTDGSVNEAKKAGAIVVSEQRHVNGIGYGYAHMTGMKTATGDILVAMDSDDTYPVESVKKIVHWMEKNNADFISCNRLPLKNPRAISSFRQFGIWLLNTEVSVLFGFPIQDILTGMWVMNKKAVQELSLTSGDWNLSPEIKLAAISSANINFQEHHIDHFERKNALSKQNLIKTGILHAWYILHYKVAIQTGLIQTLRYAYSFFL